MKKFREIILERKFKYILLFNIILSLQFVLGNKLQNKNILFGDNIILDYIYIIVLAVLFTTIVYLFQDIKNRISNKRKCKADNQLYIEEKFFKEKHLFIYSFTLIIVCWIPAFITFFPGMLNYDGPDQLLLFLQDIVLTNSPIIHTLCLSGCYLLGINLFNSSILGIMFYVVFQMIVMAYIFSYAINFIYKITYNKILIIFSILFIAIFPYNQLFPLMTTKDTLFAGLMLLFIIKLYEWFYIDKVTKKEYVTFIIITVLMLLFRLNAIYAFILFFIFIFAFFAKKCNKKIMKRILVVSVISIFIYYNINILLIKFTNAKATGQTFILPFIPQAVARVAKEKNEDLTENEKLQINLYFTNIDRLIDRYNPSISDYSYRLIDQDKLKQNQLEFYKFIFKLGIKYPQVFLESYLDTIRAYWYIQDTSFMKLHNDEAPDVKGCLEIDFVNVPMFTGLKQYNLLPAMRNFYTDMFCRNEYREIPLLYIIFQPRNIFLFIIRIAFL
ncbi:MAG: DUF6020 family protein [Clostridia bacterium]|nr:DUF6020 family protein [Clostridia bacterium]